MEGGAGMGEDLAFTPTGVEDHGEKGAWLCRESRGARRRSEGKESPLCLSCLLSLEPDFTKEPRSYANTEGPSGQEEEERAFQ